MESIKAKLRELLLQLQSKTSALMGADKQIAAMHKGLSQARKQAQTAEREVVKLRESLPQKEKEIVELRKQNQRMIAVVQRAEEREHQASMKVKENLQRESEVLRLVCLA